MAQATQRKAEYTKLKGFDNQYYKDLILQALRDHSMLERSDFNRLFLDKLPDELPEKTKIKKVSNLLISLKSEGMIHYDSKTGKWSL